MTARGWVPSRVPSRHPVGAKHAAAARPTLTHYGDASLGRCVLTPRFHRVALVIGHPGHELRIHRWCQLHEPLTFVLTDGSGHTQHPRLPDTVALIDQLGGRMGAPSMSVTDATLYRALLDGHVPLFQRIIAQLADAFVAQQIDCVAGDAYEGMNPTHDLCRVIINAAVARAVEHTARPIANWEFFLSRDPMARDPMADSQDWVIELDAPALQSKLEAAHAYVALDEEVRQALAQFGPDRFAVERLMPVHAGVTVRRFDGKPFYELHGEARVAAGLYAEVIRYAQHVAPVEAAVRHGGHEGRREAPRHDAPRRHDHRSRLQ